MLSRYKYLDIPAPTSMGTGLRTKLARSMWLRNVSRQNRDMMCQFSFFVTAFSMSLSSCNDSREMSGDFPHTGLQFQV